MKVENTRVSRIAVSRLHLSNGEVRKNQVLEIDVETKKSCQVLSVGAGDCFHGVARWRLFLAVKSSGKHAWPLLAGVFHPLQLIIM